MAGLTNGVFREKISPYLQNLMNEVKREKGEFSREYQALYSQYVYRNDEKRIQQESNTKHYEAMMQETADLPKGIERLYRRQLVVDLTMVCAAHCRYCLRANYELFQITQSDIEKIVAYLAREEEIREILVTGGDPFLVPRLLMDLISGIVEKAPNVKIIRIGTRLPVHDPEKFDPVLFEYFNSYRRAVRFEVAIQINHPVELQPTAVAVIEKLQESGVRIYSQNVLLKNVNDNIETLIELYDQLRYLGIEAHYLFHPIPMKGTAHFRVPFKRALQLIQQLTSSGMISGRIKPTLSVMTEVGKVTLYEGTIGARDENGYVIISTQYKLEDRMRWNPSYKLPASAFIGEDGCIRVKYLEEGHL